MRHLLLALIRTYQLLLSPHKGFHCAYRVHTGRASCSALGYRAVQMHGVVMGLSLIHQRFQRCGAIHRRHHGASRRRLHSQRGDCDIGCVDVDAGCAQDACSAADCCDCDWPSRRRDTPPARQPHALSKQPLRVRSRVEPGSGRRMPESDGT